MESCAYYYYYMIYLADTSKFNGFITVAVPMITVHPNDNGPITVAEGRNVELMCEATGNGNLTYQWKRVSGLLPGNSRDRKTPTLNIRNIKVNDSGEYYCEVNDDDGGDSVSSMRVQVTVKSKSLIINCIMFN